MLNRCVSVKGVLSCLIRKPQNLQLSLQIIKNIDSQDIHTHKITEKKVKVPYVEQYEISDELYLDSELDDKDMDQVAYYET